MKICGCNNCKLNGEVNPYALFEEYLVDRDNNRDDEFELIFMNSYTVEEMYDLYNELQPQFNDLVERINAYSIQEEEYESN